MPAIHSIGYLGTHEGTDSDHCVGIHRLGQADLLQGPVNRPVRIQGTPIRIEQIDKIKTYLETLTSKVEQQKIHHQTIGLAASVVKYGWNTTNEKITTKYT